MGLASVLDWIDSGFSSPKSGQESANTNKLVIIKKTTPAAVLRHACDNQRDTPPYS